MGQAIPTDEQILVYGMMTERVGHHPLDSGGIYGYNHNKNEKRTIEEFMRGPEEWLELSKLSESERGKYPPRYEVSRVASIFHYLCGGEVDKICEEFNKLNTDAEDWDSERFGPGVSKQAGEFLASQEIEEVYLTGNSYNHDSELDGTYQYQFLKIDGEWYMVFQYHGGCDVRGGYTDAKMLKVDGYHSVHEWIREYDDMQYLLNDLLSDDEEHIERWPTVFIEGSKEEASYDDVIEFFEELLEEMTESKYSTPEKIQEVEQIIQTIKKKKDAA
jgi:hypothetical protein